MRNSDEPKSTNTYSIRCDFLLRGPRLVMPNSIQVYEYKYIAFGGLHPVCSRFCRKSLIRNGPFRYTPLFHWLWLITRKNAHDTMTTTSVSLASSLSSSTLSCVLRLWRRRRTQRQRRHVDGMSVKGVVSGRVASARPRTSTFCMRGRLELRVLIPDALTRVHSVYCYIYRVYWHRLAAMSSHIRCLYARHVRVAREKECSCSISTGRVRVGWI